MTNLTPELNLITGEDDDDTADYLTIDLASSLNILDGMFNATTGHSHNGAHQGGALEFQDLEVAEDLTVVGSLSVAGSTTLNTLIVTTGINDPPLLGQAVRTNAAQTLPSVATSAGKWRFYKATATVAISKTGGDPANCVWGPGAIAGADSFSIGNGDSVAVYCDGTHWTVY